MEKIKSHQPTEGRKSGEKASKKHANWREIYDGAAPIAKARNLFFRVLFSFISNVIAILIICLNILNDFRSLFHSVFMAMLVLSAPGCRRYSGLVAEVEKLKRLPGIEIEFGMQSTSLLLHNGTRSFHVEL